MTVRQMSRTSPAVVVAGVLVVALSQPIGWAAAADSPIRGLADQEGARISAWGQSYNELATAFEKLESSRTKSAAELKAAGQKARNLKSGFAGFENDAAAFAQKIKQAGKWNADLDRFFESHAAKSGVPASFIAHVKNNGGARATYEKCLGRLNLAAESLDQAIRQIDQWQKPAAWLRLDPIPAAYAVTQTFSDCEVYFLLALKSAMNGDLFMATIYNGRGIRCLYNATKAAL